jgi:hypothetical protein
MLMAQPHGVYPAQSGGFNYTRIREVDLQCSGILAVIEEFQDATGSGFHKMVHEVPLVRVE